MIVDFLHQKWPTIKNIIKIENFVSCGFLIFESLKEIFVSRNGVYSSAFATLILLFSSKSDALITSTPVSINFSFSHFPNLLFERRAAPLIN